MKHSEVERYEEWFTTGLVLDESGQCAGAITRNIRDGAMELFKAKAVILPPAATASASSRRPTPSSAPATASRWPTGSAPR